MAEALGRFARSWPRRLWVVSGWRMMPRLMGSVSGKAHYLDRLLDMTVRHFGRLDRESLETDLPPASMTIEAYVDYIAATGDLPHK
jgi:hypothetical protein